MKVDFKDKLVVITGATRGIGKVIAENFTDAGAKLLLTGTNPKQINSLNSKKRNKYIKYFHLDFLDTNSVKSFLSVLEKYKKIDVCINNAGINRVSHICGLSTNDWDDIIEVNLRGPFILTKETAKIMKENRYGRIVNIASIFGVITRGKRAAYTSAKAGLIGFTKTAATDLAPYNILVNSVSPGFIRTDLTKKILSSKEIRELKSLIPLGRFGDPQEIADLVLFLASDLNSYITGQNIIADGGYVNI